VESSEVTPPNELSDPISIESSLDLSITLPISPFSSLLPHPISLFSTPPPSRVYFFRVQDFCACSSCLDQTLDDSDMDRLEDYLEVKYLTLGHPMRFDFHISFDWPCLGALPSPFRDDVLHFSHSDHC